MTDYIEIGGSFGLDTAAMMTADTVCGAALDNSQFKLENDSGID